MDFEHGYAESDNIRIHYATLGDKENPMILMIHGFPDFWFTWMDQMKALSGEYYTVAMDQRGYNRSDKPKGEEQYDLVKLAEDAISVIRHAGKQKAIIMGHDWGGMVAWVLGMYYPEWVEKLVILNLPHPKGFRRELANNPEQVRQSQYARNFQNDPDIADNLTPEFLTGIVLGDGGDPELRKMYLAAFGRSSISGMINYYKRNFPKEPYTEDNTEVVKVRSPVLILYGLEDRYLLPSGLNDTWRWVDNELSIVTFPGAGHFVHHDEPDKGLDAIKAWLDK